MVGRGQAAAPATSICIGASGFVFARSGESRPYWREHMCRGPDVATGFSRTKCVTRGSGRSAALGLLQIDLRRLRHGMNQGSFEMRSARALLIFAAAAELYATQALALHDAPPLAAHDP